MSTKAKFGVGDIILHAVSRERGIIIRHTSSCTNREHRAVWSEGETAGVDHSAGDCHTAHRYLVSAGLSHDASWQDEGVLLPANADQRRRVNK